LIIIAFNKKPKFSAGGKITTTPHAKKTANGIVVCDTFVRQRVFIYEFDLTIDR
jgi:hypothetical protein